MKTEVHFSEADDCYWIEDEYGDVQRFYFPLAADAAAHEVDLRKAALAERKAIADKLHQLGHVSIARWVEAGEHHK